MAPRSRPGQRTTSRLPLATAAAETPLGVALAPAFAGGLAALVGLFIVFFLAAGHDPPEVENGLRLLGVYFILMGSTPAWQSVKAALAVLEARRRAGAKEPWRRDFEWSQTVPAHDARILPLLPIALLYSAWVVPFHLGWASPSPAFRTALGLLDVIGVGFWLALGRRVQQQIRFGRARATWQTFPARLGGPLETIVETRLPETGLPAQVMLTAFHELAERSARGRDLVRELWSETREVPAVNGRYAVHFNLPADRGLATHLSADDPTYWKLTLRVPLPGPDFVCAFLAPIYGGDAEALPQPARSRRKAGAAVRAPEFSNRRLAVALGLMGSVGLVFGGIGAKLAHDAWQTWTSPHRVVGTVAGENTRAYGDGRTSNAYGSAVRYEVGGRTYEIDEVDFHKGERVSVLHEPGNPAQAHVVTLTGLLFEPAVFSFFAFACLGAALMSYSMFREPGARGSAR